MRSYPSRSHGIAVAAAGLLACLGVQGVAAQTGWAVSELVRIGHPEVEFAGVSDVAVTRIGDIWIADGPTGELHKWSEADGSIRLVAGAGVGPGELRPGALELVVVGGDSVVVVEPASARMSIFTPGGRFVRTWSFEAPDGVVSGWRFGGEGRFFARVNRQTLSLPGAEASTEGDPIVVFDVDGQRERIAAKLPPAESFRMGVDGRPSVTLLGSQPIWDLDADGGIVSARTDTYEVRRHGPNGDTTIVVRHDRPTSRVSTELADKARLLLAETMAARRMPAQAIEALVGAAVVAERAPVIGSLLVGPGGTLWIQDAATSADELVDVERPGGPLWEVFTSTGDPLGSVTLPVGFRPIGWKERAIFGVAIDEFGLTRVLLVAVHGTF